MDIKFTTYLAGFIEASPDTASDWRDIILKELDRPDTLIYCPMKFEAMKTGKPAGEHVKYCQGLKQAGIWNSFKHEMRKIWYGHVKPGVNRYDIIKQFQYLSIINGNKEEDLKHFGDFEAVARSNFIIVNYKASIPTWGTPAEALEAFFLNIPIYVISDVPKTKMNSTFLWWVLETKGEVFYSLNDCVKFIKEKYKL